MASPAAAFGDDGFQSVIGVEGEHVLGGAGPLGPLGGECGVGLQDGGGQDFGEPGPGHHPDHVAEGVVDVGAGFPRQGPGLFGDFAGLPGPNSTSQHPIPQPGQPVPQIQRISDQRSGGCHAGALEGT
jgi:hypothetical protein